MMMAMVIAMVKVELGDNDDDDERLNVNGKTIKNLLRWQCIRYLVIGVRLAKLKGNQTIY